ICSSLNLDRFTACLPLEEQDNLNPRTLQGSRSISTLTLPFGQALFAWFKGPAVPVTAAKIPVFFPGKCAPSGQTLPKNSPCGARNLDGFPLFPVISAVDQRPPSLTGKRYWTHEAQRISLRKWHFRFATDSLHYRKEQKVREFAPREGFEPSIRF
ncbi:hypothetical protein, partial [Sphingomonas sp. 28-62-20]|uniref:hypothetical protein n=1 Tax=Sphingomonas sp. 28-62-20 TaxID=1970433 RepID=UPI0035A89B96